ncbi:LCP family protein [Streptomyces sp. P6-2-1]|uniref:LCP family protein n=1 Tax=Streptomyces sp. P6-2-1 TaxID=3422591 RepID=UPI003D36990A
MNIAHALRPHWVRWAAFGLAFLLLALTAVVWGFYRKLDRNIKEDTSAAAELRKYDRDRPSAVAKGAQNILLIGSDSRAGKNKEYGRDGGTQRSDTTILLHVSRDRKRATAVSVPRDLMVPIPSCRGADGKRVDERLAQFNWAFESGGTACTVRTVEKMTNVRIDHYVVVDFEGFKKMVDAVGGVKVCVERPIDDKDAHLKLAAGNQRLNGEEALGYVRVRKTLGNGSDTDRIDRQQRFLAALVSKMSGGDVLYNPAKLYPVLDAATSALTTDPGLASLRDLYGLVRDVRSVPTKNVRFLTVPREAYAADPNRDQLVQPAAERLFAQLRNDSPVRVDPDPETSPSPRASESGAPDRTEAGREGAEAGAGRDPAGAGGDAAGTGSERTRTGRDAAGTGNEGSYRGTTAADTGCPGT